MRSDRGFAQHERHQADPVLALRSSDEAKAPVTVKADGLKNVATTLLLAMGCEPAEAVEVADHLIAANLKGHDSHGVGMLPIYARNVEAGKLRPNQHARRVGGDGQFAIFEGNMGFGHRIAREVTDWAIETARSSGAAFAGLREVQHVGRVGTFGERVTRAGMVFVSFVNGMSGPPYVAPFRGTDGRMATNPICIALPDADPATPLLLDFATSKVAMGKVRVAYQEGRQMEQGLLIDKEGNPTTDPAVLWPDRSQGAILPFGEHKGYGLAVICELLAGALVGGGTYQPQNSFDRGQVNAMLSIVFDPQRLTPLSAFQREMSAYIAFVKASPSRSPDEPVLVAGEPERINEARRRAEGIPIDAKTWADIVATWKHFGLRDHIATVAGI